MLKKFKIKTINMSDTLKIIIVTSPFFIGMAIACWISKTTEAWFLFGAATILISCKLCEYFD